MKKKPASSSRKTTVVTKRKKAAKPAARKRIAPAKAAAKRARTSKPRQTATPAKTSRSAKHQPRDTRPPGDLDELKMHGVVVSGLQGWFGSLDEHARDEPLVGSAGGPALTPRSLVEHVTNGTSIGSSYLQSIQRLAVRQVLQKFGRGNVE